MSDLDARALIAADLAAGRRARALHFRAALVLAALVPALLLVGVGLRPDLLRQPTWLIAAQSLVWTLALVALPALGLGLWFPGRGVRALLGALAAAAALLVAAGPELFDLSHGPGGAGLRFFDGCTQTTLLAGALLLALGAVSGAFSARRRRAATLWISAAIALVAVDTVAWHCPATALSHTLPSHLGAALVLLLLAAPIGAALHRRQRAAG